MNEHCFKRQMFRRTIQRSAPAKSQHIYMHDGAHGGKSSQGIQTQANHIKGLIHTFRALLLAQKPYVGASASASSRPPSSLAATLPTTLLPSLPMLRMPSLPILPMRPLLSQRKRLVDTAQAHDARNARGASARRRKRRTTRHNMTIQSSQYG